MKNFLDLLDTDFSIDIEIEIEPQVSGMIHVWLDNVCIYSRNLDRPVKLSTSTPALKPIEIRVEHSGAYVRSLKFDGWESRPAYGTEQPNEWHFSTDGLPFYRWQHCATGQGWLLAPQM